MKENRNTLPAGHWSLIDPERWPHVELQLFGNIEFVAEPGAPSFPPGTFEGEPPENFEPQPTEVIVRKPFRSSPEAQDFPTER